MRFEAIRRVVLGLLFASVAAACGGGNGGGGGGDGGSGGSGGSGGGSSSSGGSVIGTKQMGDCAAAAAFAEQCDAEGGVLRNHCRELDCESSRALRATCEAAPPPPSAGEFSCKGLFNCAVGELCVIKEPAGDGCFSESCEVPMAECADDPTCACLQNWFDSCEEDADGNVTVQKHSLG